MSGESSPQESTLDTSNDASVISIEEINNTASLEGLQTEEQRRVLDTVARVRKCGLEGTVSLPQIVVCGDQSAGKSSVLEALTEIPFPRNDNLCTRYATEISLRLATIDSITIRVIPDTERPQSEQIEIKKFEASITDFNELPDIMDKAMVVMGIGSNSSDSTAKSRAFARDVLSIEIAGPGRPQLTLVDIPGLIGAETKQTTKSDIALVAEITKHYIEQPRTICLAVVSAATDYANQSILSRVREVDPDGDRTLGVITKPDQPAAGSGSEQAYIELAQNEDIFFKLGWHVVKNRKFDERDATLEERNMIEATFFRTSNWRVLPKENVGIDTLRRRLSILLFEHVKMELPKLHDELDKALESAQEQLEQLGEGRSTATECKAYLTQLSLDFQDICKAAIDGHYERAYFHKGFDPEFNINSAYTVSRTRAAIQVLNTKFADEFRTKGYKYHIEMSAEDEDEDSEDEDEDSEDKDTRKVAPPKSRNDPKPMNRKDALEWARKALVRNRGKELVGNFNPLLIGELLWEQSEKWEKMASAHIDKIAGVTSRFLQALLRDKCPEDVENKVWTLRINQELKVRKQAAVKELALLMKDHRKYPINYNHYYTNTVCERRRDRSQAMLTKTLQDAASTEKVKGADGTWRVADTLNIEDAVIKFYQEVNTNMETFSCEEAIDCLFAIYKVTQKTFLANVTTQVIERHIVDDLDSIFSPIYVNALTPEQALALASEPPAAKRKRDYLQDQIQKLEEGQEIFNSVM